MGTVSANHSARVALVYDERMCNHWDPHNEYHPETPERIRAIWKKLWSSGISQRCTVLDAKEVEEKYLALVHTKKHIDLIKTISHRRFDSYRSKIASKFNSVYFSEGSSEAACLAAGAVVEVSERVAKGEFQSAATIIRPPGHHAELDMPMGFCLFNNVAVAASFLLNERPEFDIRKILIVDWDVHHGNGTQKMFWKDPRVLFFSVHRHDFGKFYPGGDDSSHSMVGEGVGRGYNINVPWEHGQCGDADYLAVWDHVLVPVAKAYNPDFIFISGGFDAAIGDPLGGCCVTPYGYSVMINKLMSFAGGKIVLALEGGYNLDSVASSFLACVQVLLGDGPINAFCKAHPFESTRRVIQAVRQELCPFWPTMAEELPERIVTCQAHEFEDEKVEVAVAHSIIESAGELHVDTVEDIGLSLSSLQLGPEHSSTAVSLTRESKGAVQVCGRNLDDLESWRIDFSKIDIWYGCYGSNMWMPRFLCYIKGGQIGGMQRACCGSRDTSPPKEIVWKTVPHRLFFGHSHTLTWGPGGAAFLHPESSDVDKAYMCLYKITLEQFNDVLHQENCMSSCGSFPLFGLSALESVTKSGSLNLETLKDGWYSNVVYLGTEQGLSVLTMTCSISDIHNFMYDIEPMLPPSDEYKRVLLKGLVEGRQASEEEGLEYISAASCRSL